MVGNLTQAEALELASQIGARVLVPIHYGMARNNDAPVEPLLEMASRQPGTPKILCLRPRQDLRLSALNDSRPARGTVIMKVDSAYVGSNSHDSTSSS